MAHALPVTKLAGLLVKTLAKPVSKRIKFEFSRYEFTKQALISIGQKLHTITSRMQIWSAGYQVRSIKPIDQEIALKDGAEFVGEAFVFLVSGSLVVFEYNRSSNVARLKEEQIQAKAKAERDSLRDKLIALDARLKALESVVNDNQRSLLRLLGGKAYVPPDAKLLVEIDDEQREELPSSSLPTEQPPIDGSIQANPTATSKRPWWNLW